MNTSNFRAKLRPSRHSKRYSSLFLTSLVLIITFSPGCEQQFDNLFERTKKLEVIFLNRNAATSENFDPKQVETQIVTVPGLVNMPTDVLFVVDNSPSMGDEQESLRTQFQNFVDEYVKVGNNFRLGVIATDGYRTGQWLTRPAPLTGLPEGQSDRVLDTRAPSGHSDPQAWLNQVTTDFKRWAKVGEAGNTQEAGMESLFQFLQNNQVAENCPLESATNPDCFFRPNSIRVIVMVSDEDDRTQWVKRATALNDYMLLSIGGHPVATKAPTTYEESKDYTLTLLDQYFRKIVGPEEDARYYMIGVLASENIDRKTRLDSNGNPSNLHTFYPWHYWTIINSIASETHPSNSLGKHSKIFEIRDPKAFQSMFSDLGETLETVSQRIVTTSSFQLQDIPDGNFSMELLILRANGSVEVVPKSKYLVDNITLQILDSDFLSRLSVEDRLSIVYTPHPQTVYHLQGEPSPNYPVSVFLKRSNGTRSLVNSSFYTIERTTLRITDEAFLDGIQAGEYLEFEFVPKTAME